MWLRQVEEEVGHPLPVTWRYFSLEQVHRDQEGNASPRVWELPDDQLPRGVWAFRAAEAARRQGEEAFRAFHPALLSARHSSPRPEDRIDLSSREALAEVARRAGLDAARFARDLEDRGTLEALARDHTEAVQRFGVFGTPTFLFPNGGCAFLKFLPVPREEALSLFRAVVDLARDRLYLGEVKRPQPPWPRVVPAEGGG